MDQYDELRDAAERYIKSLQDPKCSPCGEIDAGNKFMALTTPELVLGMLDKLAGGDNRPGPRTIEK